MLVSESLSEFLQAKDDYTVAAVLKRLKALEKGQIELKALFHQLKTKKDDE